jgi:hypothetical protein
MNPLFLSLTDPFASFFGMPQSNDLFGPMFSSSQDPFFGSFGGEESNVIIIINI